MGNKLIEWGSRGMTHLESVACSDELTAVPPADRVVHGEEIGGQCHKKNYQFTTALLKMSSHSSVTISSNNEFSTAEKSSEAA